MQYKIMPVISAYIKERTKTQLQKQRTPRHVEILNCSENK